MSNVLNVLRYQGSQTKWALYRGEELLFGPGTVDEMYEKKRQVEDEDRRRADEEEKANLRRHYIRLWVGQGMSENMATTRLRNLMPNLFTGTEVADTGQLVNVLVITDPPYNVPPVEDALAAAVTLPPDDEQVGDVLELDTDDPEGEWNRQEKQHHQFLDDTLEENDDPKQDFTDEEY